MTRRVPTLPRTQSSRARSSSARSSSIAASSARPRRRVGFERTLRVEWTDRGERRRLERRRAPDRHRSRAARGLADPGGARGRRPRRAHRRHEPGPRRRLPPLDLRRVRRSRPAGTGRRRATPRHARAACPQSRVRSGRRASRPPARCAATVPTSNRTSPPPTSLPRSISTTPNSWSASRTCRVDEAIARLEHVQREQGVRKQHGAQWEHGQGLRPGFGHLSSSGPGPRAGPSRAGRVRSRRGPAARDAGRTSTPVRRAPPRETAVLEVGEHASEDLVRRRRREVLGTERGGRPVHLREEPTAAGSVVARPAVERVAPHVVALAVLHDEVTRHPHPAYFDADAPTRLHHQQRQRDGNSGASHARRCRERSSRDRRSRSGCRRSPRPRRDGRAERRTSARGALGRGVAEPAGTSPHVEAGRCGRRGWSVRRRTGHRRARRAHQPGAGAPHFHFTRSWSF